MLGVLSIDSVAFPPEGWAVDGKVIEFFVVSQAEATRGRDVIVHVVEMIKQIVVSRNGPYISAEL